MLLNVKGLIIRETILGDSDKILTILTAENGKLSVMGKGIKSLKNKFMTATQLFCYSEFILYKKTDRYWLNEAGLIDNFFNIRCDIENLAIANYVLDIANDICIEDTNQGSILKLALNTLYCIAKKNKPLYILKGAFELRAISIAGFLPDLVACRNCGCYEAEKMYLDVMNGKITCDKCTQNGTEDSLNGVAIIIMELSQSTLTAMRYIIYSKAERVFSFTLADDSITEFSNVCEKYILNHLERNFTTLDFYKNVIN